MIYKKEICLELRKLRHRHTPALFLAVFALISAWMAWCFHDMDISRINDPAAMIYINAFNEYHSVPHHSSSPGQPHVRHGTNRRYLQMALHHAEAGTYLPRKGSGGNRLYGCIRYNETVLFHFLTAPIEPDGSSRLAVLYASLFFALFLTSLSIFIVQLNLSLKFSNQLTPIFRSIGGTFTGLFSWFLHQLPLRFLIPWGYYAALCRTGYVYDEATRYTTCYWAPYPYLWTAVLAAAIAFLYCGDKRIF